MNVTQFLTTESFDVAGLNIYTSCIIIFLAFIILMFFLKSKKIEFSDKKIFSAAFLSLSIFTLFIAAFYTLTGLFLFSEGASLRIYMFIATIGILLYIKNGIKDLLQNNENSP